MTKEPKQAALEKLWRQSLSDYEQDGLQLRLEAEWRGDGNVARISEELPTFQPGYVGQRYFEAQVKLVLLLQNPGEGAKREKDQRSNDHYLAQLKAFARGEFGFEEFNDRIEDDVLGWDVYKGKGIVREAPAVRLPLITVDVRPSISEVAHLNCFPFKTRNNADPVMRSRFLQR